MLRLLYCLLAFTLFTAPARCQLTVGTGVDTSDARIRTAALFLEQYLREFEGRRYPDYRRYWSKEDCDRTALPDGIVHAITADGATYRFADRPALFFAADRGDHIHLKTLFASADTSGAIMVWAITNHYIVLRGSADTPCFMSELQLNRHRYRSLANGSVTYHFPAGHAFDPKKSNAMLCRLGSILQDWGMQPVPVDYYFADDATGLARMQGMNYVYAMDDAIPTGASFPERREIFTQGKGEGDLHEMLHIYFNPRYLSSPMNHALIYYLAGGLGHDFDWFIRRMNAYLKQYPETDLENFETLRSKDPMLHLDYVVKGLLCKMIDERDGTPGLKRALTYKTTEDLLRAEFGVEGKEARLFLKAAFARYPAASR